MNLRRQLWNFNLRISLQSVLEKRLQILMHLHELAITLKYSPFCTFTFLVLYIDDKLNIVSLIRQLRMWDSNFERQSLTNSAHSFGIPCGISRLYIVINQLEFLKFKLLVSFFRLFFNLILLLLSIRLKIRVFTTAVILRSTDTLVRSTLFLKIGCTLLEE